MCLFYWCFPMTIFFSKRNKEIHSDVTAWTSLKSNYIRSLSKKPLMISKFTFLLHTIFHLNMKSILSTNLMGFLQCTVSLGPNYSFVFSKKNSVCLKRNFKFQNWTFPIRFSCYRYLIRVLSIVSFSPWYLKLLQSRNCVKCRFAIYRLQIFYFKIYCQNEIKLSLW